MFPGNGRKSSVMPCRAKRANGFRWPGRSNNGSHRTSALGPTGRIAVLPAVVWSLWPTPRLRGRRHPGAHALGSRSLRCRAGCRRPGAGRVVVEGVGGAGCFRRREGRPVPTGAGGWTLDRARCPRRLDGRANRQRGIVQRRVRLGREASPPSGYPRCPAAWSAVIVEEAAA